MGTNSAHYRLCPKVISESNSVQLFPCPPRALSKPTFPIPDSVHQRVLPNVISKNNPAHYRLYPKVISEYNSVQPYPCPFRTLSKPPSSVHQRICPNVIPKSNSVQLFPCPPRALSKPTLPITDSV